MVYQLTPEQDDLYRYTFEIWAQEDAQAGADPGHYALRVDGDGVALDSVRGYLESTPETDEPGPVGRTKTINIFTLDKFHVHYAIPVGDTDYVRLVGAPVPNYPLLNRWWAIQGNTRTHVLLANKQVVYGKQTEDPNG